MLAPERNARSFSLNVGFTTSSVGVTVLTLMHKPLSFSLRRTVNNPG